MSSMRDAASRLLVLETSDPGRLAAPGWTAFCASLTEGDAQKRHRLRQEARTCWTEIGSIGLIRDYLDFEIGAAVS